MFRRFALPLSAAVLLLLPGPARAQNDPLSKILLKTMLADITLAPPPPTSGFPSHEAHFTLLTANGSLAEGHQFGEVAVPVLFNSTIVAQLSTFPIGSSSGGFTWQFDPAVGTFSRTTSSFGPSFAERAITMGRNKMSIGMNYLHSHYDRFGGQNLGDGSVSMYLQHEQLEEPGQPAPFFEGDVIKEALSVNLTTDTAVFNAVYGLTNRLDIGVAVPVVRVSLKADVVATIQRLATSGTRIHVFANGTDQQTYSGSGTASGVGDVLLRGKYNFYNRRGLALAGAVDLRLPTGDEQNLLGSGTTATRLYFVLSRPAGRYTPHVNLGYTFTSGSNAGEIYLPQQMPNEVNYTVGLDAVVNRRLTVAGDFLGRSLNNIGHLSQSNVTFNYFNAQHVAGSATFPAFTLQPGNLGVQLMTLGAKYNPTGNVLISGNIIVPVTHSGLYARITPIIGVDYAF